MRQAVEALKNIGVDYYDSFITDGHSEYFGKGGHKVISPPAHEKLSIAETSGLLDKYCKKFASNHARNSDDFITKHMQETTSNG
jgi:hypothetical protein